MGKNFLKEWKLKLSDMSIYAAIEIALFILGVCSQYVSRRYDNNLPLGTLMAALSVGFILLLGFLFDFYMGFHLAVSYGKTRKNFLLSVLPTYVSYGFLFAVTIKLLLELETILWRIVGKGKLLEWPYDTYASVGWLLLYSILLTGLSVSMGTIICRFKTKGAVALLIIWILLPFMERFGLVPKGEIEKLVLGFFTWNPGMQAGVFLAAGMFLCLVPFWGLRNAQVN